MNDILTKPRRGRPRGTGGTPGAGRPKTDNAKIRLTIYLRPDLVEFVQRQAGDDAGAESRYIESLVAQAELATRIL